MQNDDDQNKQDDQQTPQPEETPTAPAEEKAEETPTEEPKTEETSAAEPVAPAEDTATNNESDTTTETPQEESEQVESSEEAPAEEAAQKEEAEVTEEPEAAAPEPETEGAVEDLDEETPEVAESDNQTPEETPTEFPSKSKDVKGARWFVVHTYSGHEAKVAATLKQRVESQKLQDKVVDILVPTQDKIEIKEGKKNKIKEKIFPGYLLIKMVLDDNTWLVVRTTPGITSFVGMGNRPTPLPDEEVASIQRFMSMEAPKFKATFSTGEAVKIVDGPFSEFLGSISEIDEEKGKLKVLVSIFGRETPVELDFLQVAKL